MILVKDENGEFKPYAPEPFEMSKYPAIKIEIVCVVMVFFGMVGAGVIGRLIFNLIKSYFGF